MDCTDYTDFKKRKIFLIREICLSRMAEAVTSSPAIKILLPLSQERVQIVGMVKEPLPHLVQAAVERNIKEVFKDV